MTLGDRRGVWNRPPGPREMVDMLHWRRGVLRGYPSLAAADTHVTAGARERGREMPAKAPARAVSLRAAIGAADSIPRPPGLTDDHPLVASGVLR